MFFGVDFVKQPFRSGRKQATHKSFDEMFHMLLMTIVLFIGTAPWLGQLRAKGINLLALLPNLDDRKTLAVQRDGKSYGKKRAMAESAAYPDAFSRCVAFLHQAVVKQSWRHCAAIEAVGRHAPLEVKTILWSFLTGVQPRGWIPVSV